MLRPFKSFLNNLQKNAETFFGSRQNSPDMNTNPEEEEEIATDSMYNIDELDILVDPLALDDELSDRTLGSGAESSYASENTTLNDFDSSEDGQIILVDVNSLKSSFTISESFDGNVQIGTQLPSTSDAINKDIESNEELNSLETKDTCVKDTFDPIALPLDEVITEEIEGARSDGSDSGLGLELCVGLTEKPNVDVPVARSNLKRRSDPNDQADQTIELKKPKRNIQFTGVTVYYFPRIQGFTCVPSQGGCTLGMGPQHCDEKSFSLSEHATQKRMQMLEKNPRPATPLIPNSISTVLSNQSVQPTVSITPLCDDRSRSSTEESESDEDNLSDNSESEIDAEPAGFLQPVSQKQRRALLKAAGIRDIAPYEKDECRDIRASREICGCSCREYCDPESCLCSQSGIKCQVDRASFPCGCTHDGCGNVFGRVEFNPKRVRTHFIHTIMRLELEKKQKKCDKQNQLQTYDGRLRLRESDDDTNGINTTNIHNQTSLGRLVNYNPANNILYPTSTIQSTSSVIMNPIDSRHLVSNDDPYGSNVMGNSSRTNCVTSLGEPPFDLHYEFRTDYAVDIPTPPSGPTQANYAMLYPNTSHFIPNTVTESIAPSFPSYSSDIPFSSLLNGNSTSDSMVIPNGACSTCPDYTIIATNDNGSHRNSSYYKSNLINESPLIQTSRINDQNGDPRMTIRHLGDTTAIIANDLNSLLHSDGISSSTTIREDGISDEHSLIAISTDAPEYQRFASDFANKLSAVHSYGISNSSHIQLHEVDHSNSTETLLSNEKSKNSSQADNCSQYEQI